MAIDREATLKKAEKLLRQGKLDGAIEEYVRLVDDQPRDWNAINALGDLYVRAGDIDRAAAQFVRVADHLFEEGFLPKAAALYKKALKVKSDDEHTLRQLGEIAARQGLLADAKTYLRQLAERRRLRGDERGAAESLIRLGTLEEADAESRVAAARAAQQLGNAAQAAALLKAAAEELDTQQRHAEALDLLVDAAQLDPADVGLRARLARECVRAGHLDRARRFLTTESAGDDPDLLLALAQIQLASGQDPLARATFTRLLTCAPDRQDTVMRIALERARGGRVESAFGCVDVVADAALLGGEWDRAIGVLRAFAAEVPHVPALIKLVELCVDAGADAALRDAQGQLADAYLLAGQGAEARVIAEDLLDQDPGSGAHAARLRAALELLGVPDAQQVVADRRRAPQAEETFEQVDTSIELVDEPLAVLGAEAPAPEPPVVANPPVNASADEPVVIGALEVDLSDALADIGARPAVMPEPRTEPPAAAPEPVSDAPPRDLESVFEDFRARVAREQAASDAGAQYERGLAHLRDGHVDDAMADLQAAARVPLLRFKAAAALGRLHIGCGDLETGVEWLERAAEAPAPTPDEGFAVLYELADVLERQGEPARALAVLMELDADAGDYRDVRGRIEHLARAQAGSHLR
ncbi:MAG: tetratricopeptide repeat protein [Acidobacteria bacterium]|nr:tetratricopeptide repeat protein [Acidobacteriota bacterium]